MLPGASAVVTDDDGRIPLVRRADSGKWSLPAGMIDPGERPSAMTSRWRSAGSRWTSCPSWTSRRNCGSRRRSGRTVRPGMRRPGSGIPR
nr:NUDIX domain-containing protein [Actinoplanes hulinensis]